VLAESVSWDDVLRWCVLVDTIDACDPSTTFIIVFSPVHADFPVMRQIDGPAEDGHLAKMVLCRMLGVRPRMTPAIPSQAEPPAPANDNNPEPTAAALKAKAHPTRSRPLNLVLR